MAKNIAASVRQKLLNKSREEKRLFQELLQYYAMERFLSGKLRPGRVQREVRQRHSCKVAP